VGGEDHGGDGGVEGLQPAQELQAVAVGERVVEQGAVGPRRLERRDRLRETACLLHLESLVQEEPPYRKANLRLVVDEEEAGAAHGAALDTGSPARGSQTVNTAPPCGRLPAVTDPPCSSTILRTIERPSPVPPFRRVKKGSKTR
jgi:hypothetical protein